ncbi:MAG: dockerin type I repeat-containing protein [Clostridia bacterium]|nr:dockerin type I repeat-containing protein [Clostridia bacterium]
MKKLTALFLAAMLAVCVLPFHGLVLAENDERDGEIAIHEVYIEGLIPPVAGETPEHSSTLYVEENPEYILVYQYWHDDTLGTDMFSEQEPFDISHMYSQGCMIAPMEGYYLADDCVYHFNGDAALVASVTVAYFPDCRFVQSVPMSCAEAEPPMGDIDFDGSVTVSDAVLALRAAMGIIELTNAQIAFGDVNGSGGCDISDAVLILRFAMGLIEEFPAN